MASHELVYVCEICQTILDAHHCKAICPNCGRMLDCSDLPGMSANAFFEDDERGRLVLRNGSDPRDWLPWAADDPIPGSKRDADSVNDMP